MRDSGAKFSIDRKYRYVLWRKWDHKSPKVKTVLFIGLNPSVANEHEDDPTIRRCKRFASDWGYGSIRMVNLFAICATDPGVMKKSENPIGGSNNSWLLKMADNADLIVCAWGNDGAHWGRSHEVKKLLKNYSLKCLGLNNSGEPKHPLYIKADKEIEPF